MADDRCWQRDLKASLQQRRETEMLRRLCVHSSSRRLIHREGAERALVNFSGNDYLGLACHPRLIDAVVQAAQQQGVGAGASQLISGYFKEHADLQERWARFKHAEEAALFPTGYMANQGVAMALAGREDVILLDKLNHASLIDGARLSGATVRVFPHKNLKKLEGLLAHYRDRARRRLIVTDAVFSMDGDMADLPALCELRDQYDAILVVDEAHATGVMGATGAGLAEAQGVAGAIDVTVSTGGKAMGSLGGLVTADRCVIETLVNEARSLIYTTSMPPTQVAALMAAMSVVEEEPDRRKRLHEGVMKLRHGLIERGWKVPLDPTPIIPVIVGAVDQAVAMSSQLAEAGFLVPAIRPPTVPRNGARLRISLRSDWVAEEIDALIEAIGEPGPGH